jgi:hypothetical protein
MGTTVGNFTAIDDTEVDAESPITESLITRLRDNAYWVNEGTTQTSQGTGDKLLQTDGAGGVEWIDKSTVGIDGTKGSGTLGSGSGAPTVIAIVAGKILHIIIQVGTGAVTSTNISSFIDATDDTFVSTQENATTASGTLTGSFANLGGNTIFQARKNGTDYEFYENTTGSYTYIYLWI